MTPLQVRKASGAWLEAHGVPLHPHLPLPAIGDQLRSAREVAERVVVLYSLAGVANGANPRKLRSWLAAAGAESMLGAEDLRLLSDERLSAEDRNGRSWMQESLFVLCWCIGVVQDIPFPGRECDLQGVFSAIPPEVPVSKFVAEARMRSMEEIARETDRYLCLHAAMRHPELWASAARASAVKFEVVLERRHALEWVCARATGWYDVSLDT